MKLPSYYEEAGSARYRRRIVSLTKGKKPNEKQILGLAATFPKAPKKPFYRAKSQAKPLWEEMKKNKVGLQIRLAEGGGSVQFWKSGKATISGNPFARELALEYIQDFTQPWEQWGQDNAEASSLPSPSEAVAFLGM